MKHFIPLFISIIFPLFASAYEGVLQYTVKSSDRDWSMVCYVKGDYLKAEIRLGEWHTHTILRNDEGLMLRSESEGQKQVFLVDYDRQEWGKKDKPMIKKKKVGKYKHVEAFSRDEYSGEIYSVKKKRKDYYVEMVEDFGSLPAIFFDQFKSLSDMYYDAIVLCQEHPGFPVRIYRKGKPKDPLVVLESHREKAIDDSVFATGDDYLRAKMKFRMR